MADTPARLLRLLSLLQARAFWTGADLAERLAVTPRTVRRDVTRLRDLGYPIEGGPGPHGGYRLGSGGALPPLLLDDDEAVAVAVGLRAAASGSVTGIEESAVAALAKLEQVLPAPLRHRVAALYSTTVALTSGPPAVDATALVAVAQACRGAERLRFTYRDHADHVTERTVEPFRLVHTGRRWYLVALDVRARDWRTFRLDRVSEPVATGHRFTIDDPPDAAALVSAGLATGPYRHRAVVRVDAPPERVQRVFPRTVAVLEPAADGTGTVMTVGGDSIEWIAVRLAAMPFAFEVTEPDELRTALRALGRRLVRSHPRSPAAAAPALGDPALSD